MASYQTERENFLVTMQREGMSPEIARRILRHANTYQRLAVVECNWAPKWYTEDVPCPVCDGRTYTGKLGVDEKRCELCDGEGIVSRVCAQRARCERLIREWCAKAWGVGGCDQKVCVCHDRAAWKHDGSYPNGCSMCGCHRMPFEPVFQGDPRGATVKLRVPSGSPDDMGRTGICVPTRRY